MPRQAWEEVLANSVADGTAVANTTTETVVYPAVQIPAGYMYDGRLIRLRAFGKLSTTATPTITFTVRLGGVGGTIVAITEALTMGSGVANVNWDVDAYIQGRVNGATGAVLCWGTVRVHTAVGTVLLNVFSVSGFDAPAQVTVDLSVNQDLVLTADWSAASASNTLTAMHLFVESMN